MTAIQDMDVRALNDAETSENRIHSDEIALKYGFTGALVSGVNVFCYLSQPLSQHLGETFLDRAALSVKFFKPAYHDELLRIKTEKLQSAEDSSLFTSSAYNQRGVLLAQLETVLGNNISDIREPQTISQDKQPTARPVISWEGIHLDRAAEDFLWTPQNEDNRQRVDAQRDNNAMYRGPAAYIHPYYLLDACNKALMRMFILPAWIHTGSDVIIRRPIRVGQEILIRTVPTKKWERKGHQFIRLSITMSIDDKPAIQVQHTAIFRIAA